MDQLATNHREIDLTENSPERMPQCRRLPLAAAALASCVIAGPTAAGFAGWGLTAVGSATVSAEQSPGARRIQELREKIREAGATCVFAKPQFNSRITNIIVEDTPAQAGTLDPLGATIESGPEAYFTLLRNMAASFRNCLVPPA